CGDRLIADTDAAAWDGPAVCCPAHRLVGRAGCGRWWHIPDPVASATSVYAEVVVLDQVVRADAADREASCLRVDVRLIVGKRRVEGGREGVVRAAFRGREVMN